MKKNVPAPAAAKAEPTTPAQPAAPAPKPEPVKDPRPVMSADLKLQHDRPRISPPNRGPMTGEAQMSNQAFCATFGTDEEFARWRCEVEERRAKEGSSWAWERCSHCGLTLKVKPTSPEGVACVRCNVMRRIDGGHFRRLTAEEANEHLYREAVREKQALERERLGAHIAHNAERARAGLRPLTRAEFTVQARREFEELKARGRDLARITAAYRRQP